MRDNQRALHGQRAPPTAAEWPYTREAFNTEKKYFDDVFRAPPKERGLSFDSVSYEELSMIYHERGRQRDSRRGAPSLNSLDGCRARWWSGGP